MKKLLKYLKYRRINFKFQDIILHVWRLNEYLYLCPYVQGSD